VRTSHGTATAPTEQTLEPPRCFESTSSVPDQTSCTADTLYDGSIMITASHLPYNRNGFKFFDKTAGFEKKEITDLLSRAAKDAAEGSLEEDPGFPTDKRQSEASEVAKLEKILKLHTSLVSKVSHYETKTLTKPGEGVGGVCVWGRRGRL